ncbi:sugar transferase [Halomonas sp. ZH2S]|uniref:Sugar transferase n=1 Tax=Vreelandella zhuhanensis TaxID=2684210 RepID=A0A7X3KQ43_9GAMM|nr:sugar transferase [Halomonas zhuhanensis]MWJ27523.1 sugar transferase [Halomonas zhuhanensis]
MFKRQFDFIASLIGLILLSPVLAIMALLVRYKLGAPVLFRQVRPGLHGKPFKMVKFRSMRDAYNAEGKPLPDSERITPFGRFLRSTSLDELPELWNVLKGDMSLVGPRPLLMEYMDYYTEEEMLRHTVRPGITGLAQVTGRNATTWNGRLAYDVQYVKTQTLWLDIKIIFKTICQVIKREGVVVVPSEVYQKLSDERRGDDL